MLDIKFEKTKDPKVIPGADNPLKFGTIFTDHMFLMNYETGRGWIAPRIIPYQPLNLEPSAMVFHYAQEMFEGLKAYKTADERILLFRPDKNIERANQTSRRICIPEIPQEDFLQAVKELIKADEAWIPVKEGTSLYIRPFIIATDPYLGVKPSERYLFVIILSPVGAYYPEGINPVRIWVEDEYVRAVKGGLGEAKVGANYAASLKAQSKAHEEGYAQVLWLDGVYRKYIEEVGSMNIFFKLNGTVVTPALNGSILPGVTRATVLELCQKWDIPVQERRISIDELLEASQNGTLEEAFGTGTAAVISPIGQLYWKEQIMQVQDGCMGPVSRKLYDTITGIQSGKIEDTYHWTVEV